MGRKLLHLSGKILDGHKLQLVRANPPFSWEKIFRSPPIQLLSGSVGGPRCTRVQLPDPRLAKDIVRLSRAKPLVHLQLPDPRVAMDPAVAAREPLVHLQLPDPRLARIRLSRRKGARALQLPDPRLARIRLVSRAKPLVHLQLLDPHLAEEIRLCTAPTASRYLVHVGAVGVEGGSGQVRVVQGNVAGREGGRGGGLSVDDKGDTVARTAARAAAEIIFGQGGA